MSGYYIRYKYPERPKKHICKPPGWWDRHFMSVKAGAIWHCQECGTNWIFKPQYLLTGNDMSTWERATQGELGD